MSVLLFAEAWRRHMHTFDRNRRLPKWLYLSVLWLFFAVPLGLYYRHRGAKAVRRLNQLIDQANAEGVQQ